MFKTAAVFVILFVTSCVPESQQNPPSDHEKPPEILIGHRFEEDCVLPTTVEVLEYQTPASVNNVVECFINREAETIVEAHAFLKDDLLAIGYEVCDEKAIQFPACEEVSTESHRPD